MRLFNYSVSRPWILVSLGLALHPARAADVPAHVQLPERPTPAVTLFVAVDGNDDNPGTRQRPFGSLRRARDEIRKLKGRGLPEGGVAVLVAGGRYKVAETFTLGKEDSGTETAPIVYRARDGQMPTFTGGVRLTGFVPVADAAIVARLPEEARGKVLQADLKAHGIKDLRPLRLGGFASGRGFKTHPAMELFFNGRAMQLARWPNEGYVHVVDVAQPDGHKIHGREGSKTGRLLYDGDRPNRWTADRDALLYGYWFFGWADSYEPVAAIDTQRREITLAPPYHRYGYRKGQPYYAVNLLSEIDAPGEYFIDRHTGLLYLYPPQTENGEWKMGTSSEPQQVPNPQSSAAGSVPVPFFHGAVVELSTVACPFVEMTDAAHVTLQGFRWELGCGDAVRIVGGERCLLAGCTIRRFAGNGLEIRGGRNHGLLSCDVYSMGRGGVSVSGGDRKTLTPGGHFVENCHIYNLSRIDHTYTPAVLMSGVGNRIAHNLMHDVRSSAIRLGGNDHMVELNEVYDVVWESDDQGGADMFGNATYRGNVYRYNYWHHIGDSRGGEQPGCGRAGIRLDDAISGTLVHGNVFYRCSAGRLGFGGVQIHGGKENRIENNIFVDCMAAISFSPWGEARWKKFVAAALDAPEIDKTLYLARYPQLANLAENHDVNTVTRNLAYRCAEFLRRDRGRTNATDNLVTNDDPGFADAARGVFRIDGGSAPLKTIGFQAIPFDDIGLYLDGFRKQLPVKAVAEARAR